MHAFNGSLKKTLHYADIKISDIVQYTIQTTLVKTTQKYFNMFTAAVVFFITVLSVLCRIKTCISKPNYSELCTYIRLMLYAFMSMK